jgi:hypothetical protein
MKLSAMFAGASMGALLLGGATVSAAPVTLQVCSEASCWNASNYQIADGVVVNWANAETMANGSGVSVNNWETAHGLNLDSWSLSMDSDPFVTNNFTLTNTSGLTQTYSLGVTIGIAPAIPNGAMRGSIGFSLTDNNDNGATLVTSGASIYKGMIDGNLARTLWDPSTSFTTTSSTASSISFGFPTRETAPESVDSTIGILITFSLTDGDSVAFTSNFDVQPAPVPVPAAVWLFGSGLLGLFGVSRRKLR